MSDVTLVLVLLGITVAVLLAWAALALGAEADERDEEMRGHG